MQLHRELTHYSSKVLFYKFHDTTMEHVDPIILGPWIPSLRPTPFQGLAYYLFSRIHPGLQRHHGD